MPVVRLLLPLIAALAMIVQSASAWAAIEVTGGPQCCCVDPRHCDCADREHDHDQGAPQLKRCARDPVKAALPELMPAVMPALALLPIAPRVLVAHAAQLPAMPESCADRPEKPPS